MGTVLHRLTAVLLTVTLALGAPLGTPRSCDRCPVGCPMHRDGAAPQHAGGCHHGASARADGAAIKCACGRHRVATPSAAEYGLPPRTAALGPVLVAGRLPEVRAVHGARTAPEPAAEPPRLRAV